MTHPIRKLWPLIAALLATSATTAELVPDPPHDCESCAGWSRTREPFKVWGNTWFVGGGLSSVLITSEQGHVLIDGGLTQSAPGIAANIQKLGFRLEDVKLIVNSHTHYDHAGGIAALQRASGAQVAASPAAKRALEGGGPTEDDPRFGFGPAHNSFPARCQRSRRRRWRDAARGRPRHHRALHPGPHAGWSFLDMGKSCEAAMTGSSHGVRRQPELRSRRPASSSPPIRSRAEQRRRNPSKPSPG